MSSSATFIIAPFIVAFVIFALRFYGREGAASITAPSFVLAAVTSLLAFGYLGMGVFGWLPVNGTLLFGIAGIVLLVVSVARMFQL